MLTKNAHKNGSKCPTGIAYFSTSLKTPQSRRIGKAFRLGAYSTSLEKYVFAATHKHPMSCLLYTSPSPRDKRQSRMPSSA